MDCKRFSDSIMRMIMPQSFPIGVKIIKKGDSFPERVMKPDKFGVKVALCQWITLARRWGWIVGAAADDINCTPCLVSFGFKKLKDRDDLVQFLIDMGYFDSRELAVSMVDGLEPLEPGEVKGIVAFPLYKAPVDPDLLVIYGNPAQMSRMAAGFIHNHARPIESQTIFGLSCLSTVMPYWKGEPTYIHPGRGERILGGTYDNEMLFSIPASFAEAFLDGLEKTQKKGTRYPVQSYLLYQPRLIPPMKELEDKLIDV